jgi:hypothetical protein
VGDAFAAAGGDVDVFVFFFADFDQTHFWAGGGGGAKVFAVAWDS